MTSRTDAKKNRRWAGPPEHDVPELTATRLLPARPFRSPLVVTG